MVALSWYGNQADSPPGPLHGRISEDARASENGSNSSRNITAGRGKGPQRVYQASAGWGYDLEGGLAVLLELLSEFWAPLVIAITILDATQRILSCSKVSPSLDHGFSCLNVCACDIKL